MVEIPEHILAQIPILSADGMSVEQISFMLRLHPDVVKAELEKVTTTQEPAEKADKPSETPTK